MDMHYKAGDTIYSYGVEVMDGHKRKVTKCAVDIDEKGRFIHTPLDSSILSIFEYKNLNLSATPFLEEPCKVGYIAKTPHTHKFCTRFNGEEEYLSK